MFLFSFMISHKTINGLVITLLCSPPRPSCSSSPNHRAISKRSLYANLMESMIIRTWHVRRQVRAWPKAVQKLEGRCCHPVHEHFQETLGMWTEPCKELWGHGSHTQHILVWKRWCRVLFSLTQLPNSDCRTRIKCSPEEWEDNGCRNTKSLLDEGEEEHLCHIPPPGHRLNLQSQNSHCCYSQRSSFRYDKQHPMHRLLGGLSW